MNKFRKLQKVICFIPFVSTAIIMIFTSIHLKKARATINCWLKYILVFFVSGIFVFLINDTILSGKYPVLNFIASWSALSITNIIMLNLQNRSEIRHDNNICAKSNEQQNLTNKNYKKKIFSKKTIIFIYLILTIVAMIISGFIIMGKLLYIQDIPDVNGETNYALNTIDIDSIISKVTDGTIIAGQRKSKGNQSQAPSQFEKYDYDDVYFSAKRFNGITILSATQCQSESLILDFKSEIEKGNLAIVILIDGKYYCNITVNEKQQVVLQNIQDKIVLVKIAGESAQFNVSVKRSYKAGDGSLSENN